MLNQFFLTCYNLAPFLLSFFGIAGALTLIMEAIYHGQTILASTFPQ